MNFAPNILLAVTVVCLIRCEHASAEDLLVLDNDVVQIGIDRDRGGAISWLSSTRYSKNIVNVADPGRLIQQSYYAGKSLDRRAEGQSKAWSPWPWNPIQGGGVGSWARVSRFEKIGGDQTLFTETRPKLWDMPDEEAAATMRQWTSFETDMPNVVVVKCEFQSSRMASDQWSPAIERAQEIPACYFTRNFGEMHSWLGADSWRAETQKPGPPWGTCDPPRSAMAFFDAGGQGVAVFSPTSTTSWNFGPHGKGRSDDPLDGPCMHVAPLDRVKLEHDSVYRFRYWLIVGDKPAIARQLERLWEEYADEEAELSTTRLSAEPTDG